jgi:molecular chaperone DnaK (HSP70)
MRRIDPVSAEPRELDPLVDRLPSRYVVGIDLGTTNSAVAYVDTEESPWRVRILNLPQLVAPHQVESLETLPSFHYHASQAESASAALRLPWGSSHPDYAVGAFARDEGTKTPGRLIGSAKSWLCHSGVDRTAELLPWQGAPDVERLSPIEVSSRYLRHMRDAWNAKFPKFPLPEQDVIITLPASFDEVAREFTVQAAARAQLPRVILIEEPLAAFYSWIDRHSDDWQQRVNAGQKILICDIGGGTTDFTLVRVRMTGVAADAGKMQFHRVAVGDHLILGGDNLDLALARHIEARIAGNGKLPAQQWDVLVRVARRLKETLLASDAPERLTVNLPAAGSRLIGGSVQVEVTRDEARELLVEGFLPRAALTERPVRRQSGFQEFGLPYAADPSITRYLAAFLTAHREVALDGLQLDHDPARPDAVLLNGGFFESPLLRERLLEVISSWFSPRTGSAWHPVVLENARLDLAVAHGAAYYGMVRRGEGVRVAANLARSYYIGIESGEPSAVCLVPGSAEPGQDFAVPELEFELAVSEPVEFPLYASSLRLVDRPGELVPVDEETMTTLPPIRTVLKTRRRSERGSIPVRLHARITEIGTIDLWCSSTQDDRSWRLQFDVRSATQTDLSGSETTGEQAGSLDEAVWRECQDAIRRVFAPDASDDPAVLVKRLTAIIGTHRGEWPPTLLRRIWEALMEFESGRRRSAVHESRWLNLLGYALRPGYGVAMDDWRVSETWRHVQGKVAHAASVSESWILWRRLAGGLSLGQQMTVAERLLTQVRILHQHHQGGKRRQAELLLRPQETVEVWRLLGSLELLPIAVKLELGNMIVELLDNPKLQPARNSLMWTLGRLGQRVPVYGPLNTVVPVERAASWLKSILANGRESIDQLAAMQIGRCTGDRHRDMPAALREETAGWLIDRGASSHWASLVRDGGQLDDEDRGQIVGESLPKGLRLKRDV